MYEWQGIIYHSHTPMEQIAPRTQEIAYGLMSFHGIRMLQSGNIHFCEALGTHFKELDVANFSLGLLTLKS